MPNPVNNQKGFSLLEILVAFCILAISLGILLKIFSAGVNTAIVAEDYTAAVQIAESLMAKTGLESSLQATADAGTENDKYDWEVTVSPYFFNPEHNDETTLTRALFKIKVVVSWEISKTKRRQIELITLKLANKSL